MKRRMTVRSLSFWEEGRRKTSEMKRTVELGGGGHNNNNFGHRFFSLTRLCITDGFIGRLTMVVLVFD